MENHRALFFILCLHFGHLVWAAPSRNDDRDRRLQASLNQPPRLDVDAADRRPVSLLEIMRGLQSRPTLAAVASDVQTQRRDQSGQSAHERLLLSDMGRLEDQLESWKVAEKNLEHQMSEQTATVESLKAEEAKAIHDSEVAAMVWWDCKMLLCLLVVIGLGMCIYSSTSPQSCPKTSSFNAAEPAQPAVRKARAQPEFIEKDAKPEAEDDLLVTLSSSRPAEKNVDLESATVSFQAEDVTITYEQEDVETSMQHVDSEIKVCQYFSLTEDPSASSQLAEDAWWGEAQSGY